MTSQPLGTPDRLVAVLETLAKTVDSRVGGDPRESYTAKLLQDGPLKCGKKIAEEGAELALALAAQGEAETAAETADLLYHLLVGLRVKGVSLDAVAVALADRQGISGLAEKAARSD